MLSSTHQKGVWTMNAFVHHSVARENRTHTRLSTKGCDCDGQAGHTTTKNRGNISRGKKKWFNARCHSFKVGEQVGWSSSQSHPVPSSRPHEPGPGSEKGRSLVAAAAAGTREIIKKEKTITPTNRHPPQVHAAAQCRSVVSSAAMHLAAQRLVETDA